MSENGCRALVSRLVGVYLLVNVPLVGPIAATRPEIVQSRPQESEGTTANRTNGAIVQHSGTTSRTNDMVIIRGGIHLGGWQL